MHLNTIRLLHITVSLLIINMNTIAQPVELGRSSILQSEEPSIQTPGFNGWDPLGADCAWFKELKRDISNDPVDPNSDVMLARMVYYNGKIDPVWSGSWTPIDWNWYTTPFIIVSGNTSPLTIPGTWKYNPDTNGPYMLPPEPVVYQNSYLTTYVTSQWDDGKDHHLIIFVRDESTGGFKELWEYYQPWVTWSGNQISAVAGASWRKFDLLNGETPAPGVQSTDAAGLMMMPLSIIYSEVATGSINHAIRFAVNNSDISPTFKWPARTAAGAWNPETGMPYGTRIRIKASWWDENADDVLGTGTQARIIGEAMRTYGLVLADGTIGSSIQLSGVADLRWEADLRNRLISIPVSAFEVVQTPPLLQIEGPTRLEIGETGTWTMTLLPDESPVGKGSNINIYDTDGQLLLYKFATIDEDHRSVTSQYTFDQAGLYTIKAFQPWNTGFGPFRVNVGNYTGVSDDSPISHCYPNPFSTSTTIYFNVIETSHYALKIYDSSGKKITTLLDGLIPAGEHSVEWDGTNSDGQKVSSGVYLYKLIRDEKSIETKKVVKI